MRTTGPPKWFFLEQSFDQHYQPYQQQHNISKVMEIGETIQVKAFNPETVAGNLITMDAPRTLLTQTTIPLVLQVRSTITARFASEKIKRKFTEQRPAKLDWSPND